MGLKLDLTVSLKLRLPSRSVLNKAIVLYRIITTTEWLLPPSDRSTLGFVFPFSEIAC